MLQKLVFFHFLKNFLKNPENFWFFSFSGWNFFRNWKMLKKINNYWKKNTAFHPYHVCYLLWKKTSLRLHFLLSDKTILLFSKRNKTTDAFLLESPFWQALKWSNLYFSLNKRPIERSWFRLSWSKTIERSSRFAPVQTFQISHFSRFRRRFKKV